MMARPRSYTHASQRGMVLLLALVFLCIFGALAISFSVAAGTNLQASANQVCAARAQVAAESGLQVLRYWLEGLSISGKTTQDQYLFAIGSALDSSLDLTCESGKIYIGPVVLSRSTGQAFEAQMYMAEPNVLQLDVVGSYKGFQRMVSVQYILDLQGNTVFDFGLATKGPLHINGNVDIYGVNIDIESNVYIESRDSVMALQMIGNCSIAGEVKIVNTLAIADI
ncbi:MAG: hypothetical protein QHH07_10855, partial [Sedimentisphaerales bacterium]|nr:hypothetical protein [Sedimentisphaerales bacterium]